MFFLRSRSPKSTALTLETIRVELHCKHFMLCLLFGLIYSAAAYGEFAL